MTSEKWRTAWDLYSSAREMPPGERAIFLNLSSADPEVLEEVTFLLDAPDEEALEVEQDHPTLPASFGMGRYTVIDYLGKGGMSEVYSAQDQQLGRTVAIKFLLPGTIGDNSTARVMREAKTLSGLNHPNIVTVYEVVQAPSGLAIVMELVEGAALRTFCKGAIPEDQVIRFGLQIAQALAAAHSHGIVHRDIKPENILVRPDGYVKVVDFGLARRFSLDESALAHGLTVGTLRYMSPEQVLGNRISPASDIFSLGLVLYELTTGRHPYAGTSSVQTAYLIATESAALFPRKSASQAASCRLEKLIVAMLAREPADRPSALAVARDLDATLLLSGNVKSHRTSPTQSRLWLAGLVACLVAIAIAGWLAYKKREASAFADLKIRPLTSQAGWENAPALSPDGGLIAFTWADKLDGVRNLFVKRLPDDDPLKLTNYSSGLVGYLAWSPDGRRVAFKYSAYASGRPVGGLYWVSIRDGKLQKVFDLTDSNLSSSIDWSPDGTELAFSDAAPGKPGLALYLLNLQTLKTRQLTSPPREDWGDWNPKFSPDGSTIAFKRVSGFWVDDLYLVPEQGGAPRHLTDTRRGIWGHAWLPDGQSLLISCQRAGSIFGIWRIPIAANTAPERISVGAIDAITPTTSRSTNGMAWVNQLWDLIIYRTAIDGKGTPVRLIASTLRDQGAAYSPDGRIAFVSDRSGSREIWLARADGSGQVRVTNLKGSPVDQLSWSPDGHQLAFTGRIADYSGTFVLTCKSGGTTCGEPHRLSSDGEVKGGALWSLDGRFLYFASERTGRSEIWKEPASGGQRTQVTHSGAYLSRESSDGQWLYFSNRGTEEIFRMPLSGTSGGELIVGSPYHPQPGGWALTDSELLFIDRATREHSAVIRAYNPSTKVMRSIVSLDEVFADRDDIGLSISPDQKWLLYSQLDRSGSNVVLAEGR